MLKTSSFDTPLGSMVALADEEALYLLNFADCPDLKINIEKIRQKKNAAIHIGRATPICQIEAELAHYFEGKLNEFKTVLYFDGSNFQNQVWQELQKIPTGKTCSYAEIASKIGNNHAYRAVAQANGSNQLAIVIPCHRVINSDGTLGGYAGGLWRKKWLLDHEKTLNANEKKRCFGGSPGKEFYAEYHDHEWGVPVHDDHCLFEMLILEGAQAGLSWETILKRRNGYKKAFYHFDPLKVASMSDQDLDALLDNQDIIRNRLKIYAARQNARVFLNIQHEFGSFDRYIWSFVNNKPILNHWKNFKEIPTSTVESDALSKDLKKRGMTFVGSTIIYAYMQAVGLVNDHVTDCWCYALRGFSNTATIST